MIIHVAKNPKRIILGKMTTILLLFVALLRTEEDSKNNEYNSSDGSPAINLDIYNNEAEQSKCCEIQLAAAGNGSVSKNRRRRRRRSYMSENEEREASNACILKQYEFSSPGIVIPPPNY